MKEIIMFSGMDVELNCTYGFNGEEFVFLQAGGLKLPFSVNGKPISEEMERSFGRVYFDTVSHWCKDGDRKRTILEDEKLLRNVQDLLNTGRSAGISLADARAYLAMAEGIIGKMENQVAPIRAHYDRVHNEFHAIFGQFSQEVEEEYMQHFRVVSPEEYSEKKEYFMENIPEELKKLLEIPKDFLNFLSSVDGGEDFTIQQVLILWEVGKDEILTVMSGTPRSIWGGAGLTCTGEMYASYGVGSTYVSKPINEKKFRKVFAELGYSEDRFSYRELPSYARRRIWRKFIGK